MKVTIHWAYQSVGANEKLNPLPADRNLAISSGWTRINASTESEAVRLFETAFLQDRITHVE